MSNLNNYFKIMKKELTDAVSCMVETRTIC